MARETNLDFGNTAGSLSLRKSDLNPSQNTFEPLATDHNSQTGKNRNDSEIEQSAAELPIRKAERRKEL
jgi:hypothetical protein